MHARVVDRYGEHGDAIYILLATSLAVLVSGGAGWALHEPLLFPSIGPTVFLLFEVPMEPEASVRNTLIGHLTAIVAGALVLLALGLWRAPSTLTTGITWARVLAAALALGVTQALLVWWRAAHAPSGATALIIALGLFAGARGLAMIFFGILLSTAICFALNRLLGIPVPLWAHEHHAAPPPPGSGAP
jgi:CBS-domain-containing membrane protein